MRHRNVVVAVLAFFPLFALASSERIEFGTAVPADELLSTVNLNSSCTATKVGARQLLTAAHCVINMDLNELRPTYYPSAFDSFYIYWHANPSGASAPIKLKSKRTFVPTSQFGTFKLTGGDIALIETTEDIPMVPIAEIYEQPLTTQDELRLTGYGVLNASPTLLTSTKVSIATEEQLDKIKYKNGLNDSVWMVMGPKYEPKDHRPHLVPGDSGGPLYIKDGNSFKVAGVNSYISFMRDLNSNTIAYSGIARIDVEAANDVHEELQKALQGNFALPPEGPVQKEILKSKGLPYDRVTKSYEGFQGELKQGSRFVFSVSKGIQFDVSSSGGFTYKLRELYPQFGKFPVVVQGKSDSKNEWKKLYTKGLAGFYLLEIEPQKTEQSATLDVKLAPPPEATSTDRIGNE